MQLGIPLLPLPLSNTPFSNSSKIESPEHAIGSLPNPAELSTLLPVLARKQNVEPGSEVDGTRMESLKSLMVPVKDSRPEMLGQHKSLVAEVLNDI